MADTTHPPSSLRGRIKELDDIGAVDLATTLWEAIDPANKTDAPPSARVQALISDLKKASTRRQLVRQLRRMPSLFGCSYFVIFRAIDSRSNASKREIETNYPRAWLVAYTLRGYMSVDPVLKVVREWGRNFFWDELDFTEESTAKFFQDAKRHGIGPSGYTDVVRLNGNWNIAVCLCSDKTHEAFRAHFDPLLSDFGHVARAASEAFVRINFPTASKLNFTQAELSYLVYLWNGGDKSVYPALDQLQIDVLERSITARVHCATFTQAAMLISKMGILETPEFLLETLIHEEDNAPNMLSKNGFRRIWDRVRSR